MSKIILSLDGGGIRGVATAQFLSRVEEILQQNHNTSIRDCVDLFAGSSTGAIIALALATTKMTMTELNAFYSHQSAQEFFVANKGILEIDGFNAPKYEAEPKTRFLQETFADAKISDVPVGKELLIVAYDLERRKPVVFKSKNKNHRNLLSYEIADATSAAPTFFPTTEMDIPRQEDQNKSWLVDGGIAANNPTMCAIAEARRIWSMPIDSLRVLSVGTGARTRKISGPASRKWGVLQWVTEGHLLDLLADERVVNYQAMTITKPGCYVRVNAQLKKQRGLKRAPDDSMDDISKKNIKRLKSFGDFWFSVYGAAAIRLLLGTYKGKSLGNIDPLTGKADTWR